MTHAAKYSENTRLIKGYLAYLDECTNYDDRLKLCTEIGRLQMQNQQIDQMPYTETKNDLHNYIIEINAMP